MQSLTQKQETDFATIFGTLFVLKTAAEYLAVMQGLMAERKANYALNKSKKAEEAVVTVYQSLEREATKKLSPAEKQIILDSAEQHNNLVYSFFLLSQQEQLRVKNLIDKIKKERK